MGWAAQRRKGGDAFDEAKLAPSKKPPTLLVGSREKNAAYKSSTLFLEDCVFDISIGTKYLILVSERFFVQP